MEYLVFAAAIAAAVIAFMIKGYADDRKYRRRLLEKLRAHYGELPEKKYTPEIFEAITAYYKKHPKEGQIDDITWNDLNMDEVFKRMDHTLSSAGAEYLYYTLRTPKYKAEEFERMEEQIVYFMEHEQERLKLQKLFMELGTTGKYSLYDYLDYLGGLGRRSNRKHYIADALIVFFVIMCFMAQQFAVLCLFLTILYNITSYLKDKKEIEPYIVSFSYIMRLLDACDRLQKYQMDEIKAEKEQLLACRRKLSKFTRNSFLVMADTGTNGNPLDIFFVYIKMIFHLDLIKFNHMLDDIRDCKPEIDHMVTVFGYLETLVAVGAFRAYAGSRDMQGSQGILENNDIRGSQSVRRSCCIPEFIESGRGGSGKTDGKVFIEAEGLYHPLIDDPVKNSITVTRGVLLTGSNASGKSTFLKTIAINAILSQTIHTALAERFRTSFFRIYSSMALRDDLAGGDSYYIVEIKALQRILQAAAAESEASVLCFVDEVLRGTNTIERIAASTQILKSLAEGNVVCFAATHDIELTYLLEQEFDNYHFTEEIENQDILFNYKLSEGRSTTRNAIRLLAIMGYDEKIIREAEAMALEFTQNRTSIVDIAKSSQPDGGRPTERRMG